MTPDAVRKLALALPEAAEAPHHVTVQAIIDAIASRQHAQTAAT